MSKFERKYGRYAIRNLSLILTICYGVGFLITMFDKSYTITSYLTLDPYKILHGQIWRLVTWLLIPGSSFSLLDIIMLLFYYSIGRTLEQVWGDYQYNKYIFLGMLFTIAGSFILLGYYSILINITGSSYTIAQISASIGYSFTAFYIYMSVFLGFACTFPENRVLLMFIIPIKMKWLGIAYGVYYVVTIVYYAFSGAIPSMIVILSSLLNFFVFFITTTVKRKGSPKDRMRQAQRQRTFNQDIKKEAPKMGVARHKCAICGRTELDDPNLQFRFCSKCNGNYEYCNEHLFNHRHVE